MIKSTLLLSLALFGIVAADVNATGRYCIIHGVASQANDQDEMYLQCDSENNYPTLAATLTAEVVTSNTDGDRVGDCMPYATGSSDDVEEALDNIGVKTNPYLKYSFTQTAAGYDINLDQYGDEDCLFIQRRVTSPWGEQNCVNSTTESQGFVHDMFFTGATCGGFGDLNVSAKQTIAYDQFSDLNSSLFDPWPILTEAVAMTVANSTLKFSTDQKVMSHSEVQGKDVDSRVGLCYGVGDYFSAPYYIPSLYERDNVTYTRKVVHAPMLPTATTDGWLCGYDCTQDIEDALQANTSIPGYAIYALAQTTCGMSYRINGETNSTSAAEYFGMEPKNYFLSALMIYMHRERECNVCESDDGYVRLQSQTTPTGNLVNVVPSIGQIAYLLSNNTDYATMIAGSSFAYCQVGNRLSSTVFYDPAKNPDRLKDPTECVNPDDDEGSSPAAFASAAIAIIISLVSLLM